MIRDFPQKHTNEFLSCIVYNIIFNAKESKNETELNV